MEFSADNVFDFLNEQGYNWDYLRFDTNLNDFVKLKDQDFCEENGNFQLLRLTNKWHRTPEAYTCHITTNDFEIFGFNQKTFEMKKEKDFSKEWQQFLEEKKSK